MNEKFSTTVPLQLYNESSAQPENRVIYLSSSYRKEFIRIYVPLYKKYFIVDKEEFLKAVKEIYYE